MVATESKSKTIRALRGGQMTIPIEIRKHLGIDENTLLSVSETGDGGFYVKPLIIEPAHTLANPSDSSWIKQVYDAFEPVRREIREKGMSEDEVDSLIDEAFRDVRAELYGTRKP
jgi:AbrB family looped-hinge helix DNA binding protein